MTDKTLADVRAILEGLPDTYSVRSITMDDPDFVIVVNSKGDAQRIVAKTKRSIVIFIDLPVAS